MSEAKECVKCSVSKPIEQFYLQNDGKYQYRRKVCRQCCRKQRYNEHGYGVFKQVIHNFIYRVKS